ncbi:MAG: hypothetical protein FWC56_02115, partial [Phycisphaerae bacterium]|nr:hypothetical protein [Phycisphaerae bacterium]
MARPEGLLIMPEMPTASDDMPATAQPVTIQSRAAQPMADSGLLCLQCEYNLTGTIAAAEAGKGENRCPECGMTFNPNVLRARLA